jgi:uncharacterized membrane protein
MTRLIAGFSLLGLAVAGYLTWVHYADIEPLCTAISDCERVQSSDYALIAGVPVALVGLIGYAAILLSLRFVAAEVTAGLAYVGVAFSAYLTWAELFRIDAICQWCVASALIMLAIAVIATVRVLRPARRPVA